MSDRDHIVEAIQASLKCSDKDAIRIFRVLRADGRIVEEEGDLRILDGVSLIQAADEVLGGQTPAEVEWAQDCVDYGRDFKVPAVLLGADGLFDPRVGLVLHAKVGGDDQRRPTVWRDFDHDFWVLLHEQSGPVMRFAGDCGDVLWVLKRQQEGGREDLESAARAV